MAFSVIKCAFTVRFARRTIMGRMARNSSGQHNMPRYYCRVAARPFCDTAPIFFLRRRFKFSRTPLVPPGARRNSPENFRIRQQDETAPSSPRYSGKGAFASRRTPSLTAPVAVPFHPCRSHHIDMLWLISLTFCATISSKPLPVWNNRYKRSSSSSIWPQRSPLFKFISPPFPAIFAIKPDSRPLRPRTFEECLGH